MDQNTTHCSECSMIYRKPDKPPQASRQWVYFYMAQSVLSLSKERFTLLELFYAIVSGIPPCFFMVFGKSFSILRKDGEDQKVSKGVKY